MEYMKKGLAIIIGSFFLFPKQVCAATVGKSWALTCGSKGVQTALGCFDASGSFVQTLLNIGFGMAGGIAFLLILYGGFQIIVSAGNPEKLNEAREIVTAAIVGLLFVLFSVFILRFIGVDVLQLPGFG